MNKNRLIILVGIAVCVVVLIGNLFMTYVERNTGPELHMNGKPWATSTPASQEIRYFTEDEIIATMEKNLEEYFPGRWSCSVYEQDERTIVDVRFRSDNVAGLRDLAIGGVANMPQEWDKLVESTRVSSGNWRDAFEMNRHYGYMVQFGYVDDSAPDELVFYCINGVTALDPVHGIDLYADAERAMAGLDYVPQSSPSYTYVVNIDSKVFHLSGCGSAGNITPKNRVNFNGDRADLIAQGYTPCGRCNP